MPRSPHSRFVSLAQTRSRQETRRSSRLVDQQGGFNVVRLGASHTPWRDLYHVLLTLPWSGFLGLTGGLYLTLNALFALLYLAVPDGIANAEPGSFADAFFFSVQTMASIGYGAMYPQTLYTNILVTIESMVGLLGVAMATGLMFARFSRPTARVLFSRVAVIAPHNGVPTLIFRTANQRRNRILEAQMRVTLVRDETTEEGHFLRRFYDLPLRRSHSPLFALTWTVMHPIEAESPLYGLSLADLEAIEAEIVVTLTGLDETFAQTIHARYSYIPSEIFWQMQFADILTKTATGQQAIDYTRFHEVTPLAERQVEKG